MGINAHFFIKGGHMSIMTKRRYLTKTRFKMGLECPTKLFYTNKKEYPNQKMDDAFLEALAEGGYQVGELAKCYYPNGHNISSLDYEEAEKETLELLKQDHVVIFEPAIRFQNLFVRIDILCKNGNNFQLIEVKAKSFDRGEENLFLNKNGTISSEWLPYMYDIAFQKYVLSMAFPVSSIDSFLMLTDKSIPCPSDGLNQKFRIERDESNRKGVKVSTSITTADLTPRLLSLVPVDEIIQLIIEGKETKAPKTRSFVDEINFLASHYHSDVKIIPEIGAGCRDCEFRCSPEEEKGGLKNGFKECWSGVLSWKENDFLEPNILEVWNSRHQFLLTLHSNYLLHNQTLYIETFVSSHQL